MRITREAISVGGTLWDVTLVTPGAMSPGGNRGDDRLDSPFEGIEFKNGLVVKRIPMNAEALPEADEFNAMTAWQFGQLLARSPSTPTPPTLRRFTREQADRCRVGLHEPTSGRTGPYCQWCHTPLETLAGAKEQEATA